MLPPASVMPCVMAAIAAGRKRVAEQRHLPASDASRPVVAHALLELDLQAELLADGAHRLLERRDVVRNGHQRAEHQPAADDELLDVDHLDLEARELLEQARRDATLVGAGERDEDGGIGEVGGRYVLGHRPRGYRSARECPR